MSGIVTELEREALSKNTDILGLLRKAYVVARKLGLKEFENWINMELNGYNDSEVPSYRVVHGEVKAWNPYHGWIPVIFDRDLGLNKHSVRDPVANLVNVKSNSNCYYNFPPEINNILSKNGPFQTKYALEISNNSIYNIIEQIRNKILDWALTLEENGIVGDEYLFSSEEKRIAKDNPIVYNYVNNFYSDVNNTQIQQDSNESLQNVNNA